MGNFTKAVTDATFEQDVLQSQEPVLVDFWAEWCGPCKMVGPILEDLAQEFQGKLTIAKVNVEDSPKAPTDFGVRGIPTMILFKNGQPVATKVGALPKEKLKAWIEGAL
ncbi:thioredoxin [Commensalibacter oyaizuii]|uniref:Thioredoxin n=1 Tax=Commensalibacter oyaizuii TaxID=3043873 RepID=A0ABT6Q1L1_9PROT|nr:thioredoxin [Commensalibacter sp. TBRC 16381]MDI2090969.1 thioredoxin [Commensalibacter sp. TBRC 16381]